MRRKGIELVLMQDGAPGHAAGETKQELRERGIVVIFWPPFSPDLNPTERVSHFMKNYLQDNYPENMSYNRLREAVKDAWEKVGEHEFRALIESMPARCQAVIDAEWKLHNIKPTVIDILAYIMKIHSNYSKDACKIFLSRATPYFFD